MAPALTSLSLLHTLELAVLIQGFQHFLSSSKVLPGKSEPDIGGIA